MNKKENIVFGSDASELEISETTRRLETLKGKSVYGFRFEDAGHKLIIELEGGDKIVLPIGTNADDTPQLTEIIIEGR